MIYLAIHLSHLFVPHFYRHVSLFHSSFFSFSFVLSAYLSLIFMCVDISVK